MRSDGDEWLAWCIDEACFMWGRHVENQIEQAAKGAKTSEEAESRARMMFMGIMSRVLEEDGAPESSEPKQGQFADPAAMAGRRRGK